MTIGVLVADDQAMVRAGFAALLSAQPDIVVVGEAENGRDAVVLAQRTTPDVILMDVRMPELDGLAAAREILDGGSRARILMLTTFDVDEYVLDALRLGASGFLLKDARPQELVDAVRVVAGGDALLAPSVTRRLIERFTLPAPSPTTTPELGGLTAREREVLVLVAQGRSNPEIADELFIAEQTVKSHVGRLFAKLGARDRVQAVIMAYEAGLVAPRRR